ncbi:hypothetical protein [Marinilabilia rubra]|uniref:hypothetical protein n=1 Tax=Marinilabilia rubra TaxID=2162893 RepID=UPI0018E0775E|nr:hypothetical protein [Marinilabilia rubra]
MKTNLSSKSYQEALESMRLGAQTKGIDKVMDAMNLDAIIAPTGSPAWKTDHINGDSFQLGSSGPAAMAGYPIITVPWALWKNCRQVFPFSEEPGVNPLSWK